MINFDVILYLWMLATFSWGDLGYLIGGLAMMSTSTPTPSVRMERKSP